MLYSQTEGEKSQEKCTEARAVERGDRSPGSQNSHQGVRQVEGWVSSPCLNREIVPRMKRLARAPIRTLMVCGAPQFLGTQSAFPFSLCISVNSCWISVLKRAWAISILSFLCLLLEGPRHWRHLSFMLCDAPGAILAPKSPHTSLWAPQGDPYRGDSLPGALLAGFKYHTCLQMSCWTPRTENTLLNLQKARTVLPLIPLFGWGREFCKTRLPNIVFG